MTRGFDTEEGVEYTAHYQSPLGLITLAGEGETLTGLWFDGQRHFAATLSAAAGAGDCAAFEQARRWLDAYFAGQKPEYTGKLLLRGTVFQQRVWALLRTIPYGETTTYGALASALSKTGHVSARAVGGAVGRNPVSLIVPCHRVLGADGRLTGYAAGPEVKAALLRLETTGRLTD